MNVRLAGRSPRRAAVTFARAAEAAAHLDDVPPELTRGQRKIVRPRFRSLVDETKVLAPKIVSAIDAMRDGFRRRSPLREAEGNEFDLARFEEAIEAMDSTKLKRALTTMYGRLYRQGIAHVRVEIPEGFDLVPTRAIAAFDTYALEFSTDVLDAEKAALRTMIRKSLADGVDVAELGRDIAVFFEDGLHRTDANGRDRVVDVDDWAKLVARTETARAQNAGALASYTAAKVSYLIFVCADDERTESECRALDRTVTATGANIEGHDVPAPPIHCNCRCVQIGYSDLTKDLVPEADRPLDAVA